MKKSDRIKCDSCIHGFVCKRKEDVLSLTGFLESNLSDLCAHYRPCTISAPSRLRESFSKHTDSKYVESATLSNILKLSKGKYKKMKIYNLSGANASNALSCLELMVPKLLEGEYNKFYLAMPVSAWLGVQGRSFRELSVISIDGVDVTAIVSEEDLFLVCMRG